MMRLRSLTGRFNWPLACMCVVGIAFWLAVVWAIMRWAR